MNPRVTLAVQELLKSEKFMNWTSDDGSLHPKFGAEEKHFTPQELAVLWGVSAETIRLTFRKEPGVLRLQQPKKGKREYVLLRIPVSIAERVHRRLSAVPL